MNPPEDIRTMLPAKKNPTEDAAEPVYLSVLLNRLKAYVRNKSAYEETRYNPTVRFSVPKLAVKIGEKVDTVRKWFFKPDNTSLQRWQNFDKVLWALDMEITELLTPTDLARAYCKMDKNQRVEFRDFITKQGYGRPSDEIFSK